MKIMLDILLNVMSVPFWLIGVACVIVGIFGKVTKDGKPYIGKWRVLIKLGVTVFGAFLIAIACLLAIA